MDTARARTTRGAARWAPLALLSACALLWFAWTQASGEPAEAAGRSPLSLFDRPLLRMEGGELGGALAAIEGRDEVWFREPRLAPWELAPLPSEAGGIQCYRADAMFPTSAAGLTAPWVGGRGFTSPSAYDVIPAGGGGHMPGPSIHSLGKGQILVTPEGIFATEGPGDIGGNASSRKPGPFRPVYPVRTGDLLGSVVAGGLRSDEPIPAVAFTLAGETRDGVAVSTGTQLTWGIEPADRGATLRFGFGVQARHLAMAGEVAEFQAGAPSEVHFSVRWTDETGKTRELWNAEIPPDGAGVVRDGSVPVPDADGEIHLVVEGDYAAHPIWMRPAIRRRATGAERPNVIFVVLDTLRADRLQAYGYGRPTSPFLKRFAEGSILFEDVWSPAPWTLPSHASLLTSAYASEHGLFGSKDRLQDEAQTLAEVLRDRGYATAAFTEGGYVTAYAGFAQGFDRFAMHDGDVSETFRRADRWIESMDAPYFAFVQTYKVHAPFDPEGEPRERLVRPYSGDLPHSLSVGDLPRTREPVEPGSADMDYVSDLYDAEIAELDLELEGLFGALEARGDLENTIVVITSDHGEELGEHGHYGHGHSLYQELLGVPLLVRLPGAERGGTRVPEPVLGIDVAPTILELVAVPAPREWSGHALLGTDSEPERPLWVPFELHHGEGAASALRDGQLKYIRFPEAVRPGDSAPGEAVYDLGADPGERAPKVTSQAWLEREAAVQAAFPAGAPGQRATGNAEIRSQLKALGYGGDQ